MGKLCSPNTAVNLVSQNLDEVNAILNEIQQKIEDGADFSISKKIKEITQRRPMPVTGGRQIDVGYCRPLQLFYMTYRQ